jgi:hypothetical protein
MNTNDIELVLKTLFTEIQKNPDISRMFEKTFDERTGDYKSRIEQIGIENLSKEYANYIAKLLPPRGNSPKKCPNCGEPI